MLSHKILMGHRSQDLLPGTLDLLILSTLQAGPAHGYTIMDSIWSSSGELFRVEEGAIYPALHRLEIKGRLGSGWGLSEANRRAKFYHLTAAGKKQLAEERANWERVSTGMRRVFRASGV
jgi:PadR family transcriptional regulator, regulatory protein PadR